MRRAGSRVTGWTTRMLPLVLTVAAAWPCAAQEEDDLDYGVVYAIQARDYQMNHEFALSLGFLPLDAFYKFFAISGHYVLHFDQFWAWEAVHFSFSQYLDVDTGLKDQLSDQWSASATDTPRLHYFVDTNLMLKPLYGKAALLDDLVIYGETYILLGVGAQKFETAWFPAIDFGLGFRIFITESISLRLEVREYLYFEEGGGSEGGVHSNLYFGLGFAYNGFADDVQETAEEEVSE